MLNMVDNMIFNVIEGEMPKVHFDFPPNLTERITLILYKWYILIDSYSLYQNVQNMAEEKYVNEEGDIEERKKTIEDRK